MEAADEERKKKLIKKSKFERPTTAELLELAGGKTTDIWQSDTTALNLRTDVAQKVELFCSFIFY